MIKLLSILTACLIVPNLTYAEVIPLLKTGKSWNGGNFSYPAGQPEITSAMIRLEPGDEVPFHCRAVPTFGYILQGKIKVSLKSGQEKVFEKGQSLVEVFKTTHRGEAIEGPVELVVFYAGAKGLQNSYKDPSPECITGRYD